MAHPTVGVVRLLELALENERRAEQWDRKVQGAEYEAERAVERANIARRSAAGARAAAQRYRKDAATLSARLERES
jgi:hypothetical protein